MSTEPLVTEETTVRGTIPEADRANMTFEVQVAFGPRVKVPLAPQHEDIVLEAFNGYRDGSRVAVHGIGRFSSRENMQSFESVDSVTLLDPLDVPARLDEFLALKDGWLEGHGRAPSPVGLAWLSESFEQYFPIDLPLPHLYPTEDGGIQAEWSLAPYEASMDIDLLARTGEWYCLDLESDRDESFRVSLADASGWEQVAGKLRQYIGAIR